MGFWSGGLQPTNYLPFLLGANVLINFVPGMDPRLLNSFPANPTTWYIGTYIHVLLVWALLLRRRRIALWLLAPVAVAEVVVRFLLAEKLGHLVAYMALSNWATVFLLGMHFGQRREQEPRGGLVAWLVALGALAVAWPLVGGLWAHDHAAFPFQLYGAESTHISVAVTSVAVSFVYVVYTWLVFEVTRRIPAPRVVEFFARNTIIVFIAHMPVYYATRDFIHERITASPWLEVAIRMAVCFVGLTLLSEVVRRVVRPQALRDRVWRLLAPAPVEKRQLAAKDAGPKLAPTTAVRV
jgi:hypothetical protein